MSWEMTAILEMEPLMIMQVPLSIELDYTISPRAKTLLNIIRNKEYGPAQISIGEISALFNISKERSKEIVNELLEKQAIQTIENKDGDIFYIPDPIYMNEKSGEVSAARARLSALYEREWIKYEKENRKGDNIKK